MATSRGWHGAEAVMRARTRSTAVILCGIAFAAVATAFLPSDGAAEVFNVEAIVVGLSLGLASFIEGFAGIRNLVRVDILLVWALYGLTFFEFLFPQPSVNALVLPDPAASGTYAVILGFAGLAMGRHLAPRPRPSITRNPDLHPGT